MSPAFARVSPGYFETMGIALRGRGFTAADDTAAPGVVVVSQTMAERSWPGQDPLGKTVETQGRARTVVGVAEDVRYASLTEDPGAFLYLALAQDFRSGATLHVRTGGAPAEVATDVRRALRASHPEMPVEVRSMRAHLGAGLLASRIAAGALGAFGALGLLLSALGIYGVVAYAVSRQTREIGIRVALGADRGRVLRGVTGHWLRATLLGAGIGLALAAAAAGAVERLLYTDGAIGPAAFIAATALLGAVALVSSFLAARRAVGTDPARALRAE